METNENKKQEENYLPFQSGDGQLEKLLKANKGIEALDRKSVV